MLPFCVDAERPRTVQNQHGQTSAGNFDCEDVTDGFEETAPRNSVRNEPNGVFAHDYDYVRTVLKERERLKKTLTGVVFTVSIQKFRPSVGLASGNSDLEIQLRNSSDFVSILLVFVRLGRVDGLLPPV